MRGWLRYFALNAQVRTGVSGPVLVLAIIAAAAAVAAVIFLLVAPFVWLADLYDALTARVVLGCALALIALVACLMTRRRNMERARLELAARNRTSWFDPKLVAIGLQIGQAIGWRRLASVAALAVLAGAAAKEWPGRDKAAEDDAAED